MAAHPIVTIHDGKVEIPEELKGDPRFRDGAKLELVPLPDPKPETDSEAWEQFRQLRGIFADYPGDANVTLEEERRKELSQEEQWSNG